MPCFKKKDPSAKESKKVDKKINEWWKTYNPIIKLLLLGPGESGKTTIIKQMKILHVQGFSDQERTDRISEIRRNVLEAIKELCGNMAFIQPPVTLNDSEKQDSFDFIQEVNMMQNYEYTQEFYQHTKRLWADEGIQDCFERASEFQLVDSAKYFLDQVDTIASDTYWPSDQDILCCRKRTSDIQKIEFEVTPPKHFGQSKNKQQFWMFDVGGQRGERRKWIQVFDGIEAVLFLVACSGFDCKISEDNETNRLSEALKLFEEVWFSRFLRQSGFILFLNKQDILEKKIKRGAKVENYFPEFLEFKPPASETGDHNDQYIRARSFIKHKFLEVANKPRPSIRFSTAELYYDLQGEKSIRECYWHYTTATDTSNIQKVFEDVHTMIIMKNLNMIGASLN